VNGRPPPWRNWRRRNSTCCRNRPWRNWLIAGPRCREQWLATPHHSTHGPACLSPFGHASCRERKCHSAMGPTRATSGRGITIVALTGWGRMATAHSRARRVRRGPRRAEWRSDGGFTASGVGTLSGWRGRCPGPAFEGLGLFVGDLEPVPQLGPDRRQQVPHRLVEPVALGLPPPAGFGGKRQVERLVVPGGQLPAPPDRFGRQGQPGIGLVERAGPEVAMCVVVARPQAPASPLVEEADRVFEGSSSYHKCIRFSVWRERVGQAGQPVGAGRVAEPVAGGSRVSTVGIRLGLSPRRGFMWVDGRRGRSAASIRTWLVGGSGSTASDRPGSNENTAEGLSAAIRSRRP
jgi:hypothetical protein